MKSQILKKKNGGIMELLNQRFSKKKLLLRGQKLFWAKKIWGDCSKLGD